MIFGQFDTLHLFWVDAVWLQDEVVNTSILAALEADGEPAYELLACPGYLWLSALLFGLPSESPASPAALCPSFPFWRARCAFVWQLSIADASERGCGQCPSLFKASLADLIGEPGNTTSPLAVGNFLDPRSRSELQHATAPLLRNYKRGCRNATGRQSSGWALRNKLWQNSTWHVSDDALI